MRFINRETELGFLESKWHERSSQLIVIYGKRRVGKTETCVQFAKDKPHIYFLCERLSAEKQLQKFTEAVGSYFNDEFLPREGFRDWETAFRYIAGKKEKLIVIIDEFPYLAESDRSVPSTFQKVWDLCIKDSGVYLVLSGSSISMMERTVLFYKAPLYGRRTGQFLIKPFKFKEARGFFPDKTFEQALSIYSVVGGTPLYLGKFRDRSMIKVIENEILLKGQPLYEEVEFLLREELKEPRNYFVILEALSLGKHKLSEIINETGFDKGTVSRYLSILESLHITRKEIPVTEELPEKSRKGRYIIDDNFFNFWFRFVFRNKIYLEENRISEVIKKIEKALLGLTGAAYERLAGEIFFDAVLKGDIPLEFETFGRWWHKNEEIDMVALNSRTNDILFGEVKWSNKAVGTDIYLDLKKKTNSVKWGKNKRKEHFALFSRSGFTPDLKKMAKKENLYLFHGDKFLS